MTEAADLRNTLIDRFLRKAGWPPAGRAALAEDCSFRRYERISRPGGKAVLMDAPPGLEDVRPFLTMAAKLRAGGYSAPEIFATDVENGFLLLEDLGDATYTKALAAGADETNLYTLAMDLLGDLHGRPTTELLAGLPLYDDALMRRELLVFIEWYVPAVLPEPLPDHAVTAFLDAWTQPFIACHQVPQHLVLRDYHVDNLMVLADRPGVAACGLLDFQDAVIGPVTYDIVSLLQDSRRDVDQTMAAQLIADYGHRFPDIAGDQFDRSFKILGAQRALKVLGIFTRQSRSLGNHQLLAHIPRIWRYLDSNLQTPQLAPVNDWLTAYLPVANRIQPEILT